MTRSQASPALRMLAGVSCVSPGVTTTGNIWASSFCPICCPSPSLPQSSPGAANNWTLCRLRLVIEMLLIGSEGPLGCSVLAGWTSAGAKHAHEDIGDFVVGEGLDGVIEDLVLSIGGFPGAAGRADDHDACVGGLPVDALDQARPLLAQRGGIQENHAFAVFGQGGEQGVRVRGLFDLAAQGRELPRLLVGRAGIGIDQDQAPRLAVRHFLVPRRADAGDPTFPAGIACQQLGTMGHQRVDFRHDAGDWRGYDQHGFAGHADPGQRQALVDDFADPRHADARNRSPVEARQHRPHQRRPVDGKLHPGLIPEERLDVGHRGQRRLLFPARRFPLRR